MSGGILVPIDGTKESERILEHVEMLVKPWPARVVLLHVLRRKGKAALARAEGELGRLRAAWEGRFDSIEIRIATGNPVKGILHAALAHRCGMIALTTGGKRGLRRFTFGSTAQAVLRRAPMPVLVARPDSRCERIRKILIPLDASRNSLRILPIVQRICETTEARVTLLHVCDEGTSDNKASRLLETARARLERKGIVTSTAIRTGDPAEQILSLAEAQKIPLVAMTTHGRTGLSRAAFGSVAESVLGRCSTATLILRSQPFARRLSRAPQATAKRAGKPQSFGDTLARAPGPSGVRSWWGKF